MSCGVYRSPCPFSASNLALINDLQDLCQKAPTESRLKEAILLLTALDASTLSEAQHAQLIIPDHIGELRTVEQIFFDDSGGLEVDGEVPDGLHCAHPLVTTKIARVLKLPTLSSCRLAYAELDGRSGDRLLGPLDLSGFTPFQALHESLFGTTNNDATQYDVLLDETHHPTTSLLSSTMAPTHTVSAIIVHHNVMRNADDLERLRAEFHSKPKSRYTEDRFSRACAGMFYFTDVCFYVSSVSSLLLTWDI